MRLRAVVSPRWIRLAAQRTQNPSPSKDEGFSRCHLCSRADHAARALVSRRGVRREGPGCDNGATPPQPTSVGFGCGAPGSIHLPRCHRARTCPRLSGGSPDGYSSRSTLHLRFAPSRYGWGRGLSIIRANTAAYHSAGPAAQGPGPGRELDRPAASDSRFECPLQSQPGLPVETLVVRRGGPRPLREWRPEVIEVRKLGRYLDRASFCLGETGGPQLIEQPARRAERKS